MKHTGSVITLAFSFVFAAIRGLTVSSPPAPLIENPASPAGTLTPVVATPAPSPGDLLIKQFLPPDRGAPGNARRSPKFLIVTVPDPKSTNLAVISDRILESLIWAASDAGFELDRYQLQWPFQEREFQTLSDRRARQKEAEQQANDFGVILFRAGPRIAAREPSPLAVIVVGETPTSGVNAVAFAGALKIIGSYDHNSAPAKVIPILGPSFSGSLLPLTTQLNLSPHSAARFDIVSGMVSNGFAIQAFRSALKDRGPGVEFHSEIQTDQQALCEFREFIDQDWPQNDSAFLLSEDETSFGQGNYSLGQNPPCKEVARALWLSRYPREISRLRNAFPDGDQSSKQTARSRKSIFADGVHLDLKNDPAEASSGVEKDSIGAYSRNQSPASQQAVLMLLSETLRRHHADYLGIASTDILDSLFLSRFFREVAPGVRLFVLDSDLLFIRENEFAPFNGILSVTNFPLFGRNQYWAVQRQAPPEWRRLLNFPSRYAEGTYNAAKSLLKNDVRDNWLAEDGPVKVEDISPFPENSGTAPLWLTVVGRDGFWPVALLGQSSPPAITRHDGNNFPVPELPAIGWCSCFLIIAFVGFLHSIYLAYLLCQPVRESVDPASPHVVTPPGLVRFASAVYKSIPEDESLKRIGDRLKFFSFLFVRNSARAIRRLLSAYPRFGPGKGIAPHQLPFLFLASLVIACLDAIFGLSLWPFVYSGELSFASLIFIPLSVLSFLSVVVISIFLWLRSRFLRIESRRANRVKSKKFRARENLTQVLTEVSSEYELLLFPVTVAAIAFIFSWARLVFNEPHRTGFFFVYRSLNLTNGVSPVPPVTVLFIAFYLWCIMNVRREEYIHERTNFESLARCAGIELPPEYQQRMWSVNQCIKDIFSYHVWRPAIFFFALWLLLCQPWQTLRGLEGPAYSVIYAGLLSLLYWSMCICASQFFWTWRQFRKFLEFLELSPIRVAFSRLRKQFTWLPLVASVREHRFLISARSAEVLGMILNFEQARLDAAQTDRLETLKSNLRSAAPQFEARISKLTAGDQNNYSALQAEFDAAGKALHFDLEKNEWPRGSSDGVEFERSKLAAQRRLVPLHELRILEEELLALRFLIYMRYIFRHLRNLLGFIVAGFVLSVLSLESYPFLGHQWLGSVAAFVLLALGIAVGMVFAQMDRDPIISRITDTKASELGRTFFFRMLQFGAVPVLTIIATQVPAVSRVVEPWLQPVLEALH